MASSRVLFLFFCHFSGGGHHANAFAEETPQTYRKGDPLPLKVNKMTLGGTQLGFDYYSLPWCQPMEGPRSDDENIGQLLVGDRIESSPYRMNVLEDKYCELLCISNLGRGEQKGLSQNKVVKAIYANFHNNWFVDDLPSASRLENEATITTRYWQGFPIGFVSEDKYNQKKAYIHNHVNLEIMYHAVEGESDNYRVTRFIAQPFSIKHEFEVRKTDSKHGGTGARIIHPITSCLPDMKRWARPLHTHYDMVYAHGREPQLASGKVLFTYDVIWKENPEVHWSNRWEIYLTMDFAIPAKAHWFAIINGIVVLIIAWAITAVVLLRSRRRASVQYDEINVTEAPLCELGNGIEEQMQDIDESNNPPPHNAAIASAVLCGSGAQLFASTLFTIVLCSFGVLGYNKRGSFIIGLIYAYVICGLFGGYAAAQQYRSLTGGESMAKPVALLTAGLFPGLLLGFLLIADLIAMVQGSTFAEIFPRVMISAVLFSLANATTIIAGYYFGYKQAAFEVALNMPSASILELRTSKRRLCALIVVTMFLGSILPFGAAFVELNYLFGAIITGFYYATYGFLLVVFVIVAMICAASGTVSALLAFRTKKFSTPHQIWWCSFFAGGSYSLWVFLFSCHYYRRLEADVPGFACMYFGFMALFSLALMLMMGSVGMVSAQAFLPKTVCPLPLPDGDNFAPSTQAQSLPPSYLPPSLGEEELESLKFQVDNGDAPGQEVSSES